MSHSLVSQRKEGSLNEGCIEMPARESGFWESKAPGGAPWNRGKQLLGPKE